MPDTCEIRERHKLDLAAEVLRAGGAIRLQAMGISMLPSIWPGDVVGIESLSEKDAVRGDIVLVARDQRIFIHRLIERRNSQWITRGDAVPANDPPISESQLLGKVCAIHRTTGVVIPRRRVRTLVRMLAWMLCHWGLFRNLVLRIHCARQDRVTSGGSVNAWIHS